MIFRMKIMNMNVLILYKKIKKGGTCLFSELSVNIYNTQYTKRRARSSSFLLKKVNSNSLFNRNRVPISYSTFIPI